MKSVKHPIHWHVALGDVELFILKRIWNNPLLTEEEKIIAIFGLRATGLPELYEQVVMFYFEGSNIILGKKFLANPTLESHKNSELYRRLVGYRNANGRKAYLHTREYRHCPAQGEGGNEYPFHILKRICVFFEHGKKAVPFVKLRKEGRCSVDHFISFLRKLEHGIIIFP